MRYKIMCVLMALTVSTLLFSQSINYRQLTGTVVDDDNLPLPGAVVMVDGTKTVVVADNDGKFSLKLPNALNKITVTFLGMGDVNLAIAPNQNNVVVRMKPNNMLDEVIVAGYGVVQNRETLTGSAFEVTSEKLQKLPATRIDNLLAGQIPGMRITESNSNGRTSVSIRVRGDGSLSASNEPLWIIDGVPVYTGTKNNQVSGTSSTVSPMTFLDPDNIESMTVLKDATMTALYGADGANGVILVTTKSGAGAGKSNFSASVKYGISSIDRSTTIKRLNGRQFLELSKEGWVNSGRDIALFPYQDNEYNSYSTTDTDWYKFYTGLGQNMQASFSASSSSSKMNNYFTASYYNNRTSYTGNRQQRVFFSNKSTIKFSDDFKVQANVSGSYNHNDIFSITSFFDERPPIFEPYMANGEYRLYNWYLDDNGVLVQKKFYTYLPEREYNDNYQRTGTLTASLQASWKPFTGMELSAVLSSDLMNNYEATYSDTRTLSGLSDTGKNGYSRRSGVFSMVTNGNFRANYLRTFAGRHSVQGMAGLELNDKRNDYLYATGNGFINDSIKEIAYADAETRKGYSNTSHTRSLSFSGFAMYSYDRRYTATLTYRRQGYSSFSQYSRWGDFLAVGLNWNVKAEPFFDSKTITTLNFKFSYGNNGNSRVDTSASYGSYSMTDGKYYGGVAGAVQSSPANPGLSWETTYSANLGANIGFWNRLNFSLELYKRRTDNLLYGGRVSAVIDSGSVTRNVGEISNKGFELTVKATPVKTRDITWDVDFNGSKNWNRIEKLYKGMHTGFFEYVWIEGASKDAWWLVRWAGVDPTDGRPMWYDKDGNLTYTFSYDDRVLLPQYSREPDLYGGIGSTLRWKRLTARLQLDYTIGGYVYSTKLIDDGSDCIGTNPPVEALDHWRQPGDNAASPQYIFKNGRNSTFNTTRNLYNMTNIQLRSLSVSYSLPESICKSLRIASAEVSLIGDNLYLWTPWQNSKRNSYKTIKYSSGMMRTVSAQLSLQF